MSATTTRPNADDPAPDDATRRCWRCLQMFAEDAVYGAHPDQWWVCDACRRVLLPGRDRASS
jgi:hypothetical protein